jgi:hypothetical protein
MATPEQPAATPAQVFMTLSAIAASAAVRRPSGETGAEHARRIMSGVTSQLADPGLATGGTWQPLWFGLTPDNGNFAYIAWNSASPGDFALAVRGTVFSDPIDLMEDFAVGETVPFDTGGSPGQVQVSKGAMDAFRLLTGQRGLDRIGEPTGVTLLRALDDYTGPKSGARVFVTGHSLGGCVATMLAPYLQQQTWQQTPGFGLVTFAAPTAGLRDFAGYVESLAWSLQERHVNDYDLVPLAWADILKAEGWYPPPGPPASPGMQAALLLISQAPKGNVYVQPGAPTGWNGGYGLHDPNALQDYLGQVAFQHANPTYLALLGAPLTPAAPAVRSLSPSSGPAGTEITVDGSGFTEDSAVDFGRVAVRTADAKVFPPDRIVVTKAPAGSGAVDVRVTNTIGTSPAVPGGTFTYT